MLRVLLLAAGALVLARARAAERFTASRILRVSRVVADLDRAVLFYVEALGFRLIGRAACVRMGLAAEEAVLRLGAEEIALVRFAKNGQPYPRGSRSNDAWFQHLAIVVSDIDAAYRHLGEAPGWTAISAGGPQTLPQGGVRAFKFRDPDGHPLELIWYPPGAGRPIWNHGVSTELMLGIDHSALAVGATVRSLAFYRRLGLHVAARSWNRGPAQDRLDGLARARVRVSSLRPAGAAGPGIELLGYQPPGRPAARAAPNDAVRDWITLSVVPSPGERPRALRDPDGHWLLLVGPGAAAPSCAGRIS